MVTKIVRCGICKAEVKRTNAKTSFIHCSVLQPITSQNWINQIPSSNSIAEKQSQNVEQTNTLNADLSAPVNTQREQGIITLGKDGGVSNATDTASLSEHNAPYIAKSKENNKGDTGFVEKSTPLFPVSPALESIELEEEDDDIKELSIDEAREKYNYECGKCGAFFMELSHNQCPNCHEVLL